MPLVSPPRAIPVQAKWQIQSKLTAHTTASRTITLSPRPSHHPVSATHSTPRSVSHAAKSYSRDTSSCIAPLAQPCSHTGQSDKCDIVSHCESDFGPSDRVARGREDKSLKNTNARNKYLNRVSAREGSRGGLFAVHTSSSSC